LSNQTQALSDLSKEVAREEGKRRRSQLLREKEAELSLAQKAFEEQKTKWDEEKDKIANLTTRRVKLDVGGVFFTTSLHTLTRSKGSMLESMFGGRWKLEKDENDRVFIDRNGKYFQFVLDYLRK